MNTMSILVALAFVPAAGPSMRGAVVDSDGKPIVAARVDIATAAPRVGQGLFCPSCYRDCKKSATTDGQGRFEIRDLDPTLKFTLLASSPNRKAHHTKLVDPLWGEVKILLEPLPANLPGARIVLGQTIDDAGRPIAGALIDPCGAKVGEVHRFGAIQEVDPTVSDAHGNFSLALPETFKDLDVQITMHGYAGRIAPSLKAGSERHKIVIPSGTRVTGRLVHPLQSTAGLRVAVVQIERGARHHFIKAVGAVTDPAGRFEFEHLPADESFAIFTLVGEGPQRLVLKTKRFQALGDGQERDLGELEVGSPLRLSGKIELPAGLALPADAKITLGREPAWDLIAIPIEKDGSFVADGLPPESYSVHIAAKGFEVDPDRLSYQVLGPQRFGIRLRESLADLKIPLVPNSPKPKP